VIARTTPAERAPFEAASAEDVAEAARRAGIAFDRVVEAVDVAAT
jgi:hypothetical protein